MRHRKVVKITLLLKSGTGRNVTTDYDRKAVGMLSGTWSQRLASSYIFSGESA
jgi:hypothetical protein